MRYYEFARQAAPIHWVPNLEASAGLKAGFVDDARRAATPYVIDCPGLTRAAMGDDKFEDVFREARDWCRTHCTADHEIEAMRDGQGCLTGYRFRFASGGDATLFKTSFC
ncbi:hypothetical protein JH26_28260 [Microvirga sp. BSC39]|nr:hypothetical protein JH26_28260 [Microvirga sp. BSC39]